MEGRLIWSAERDAWDPGPSGLVVEPPDVLKNVSQIVKMSNSNYRKWILICPPSKVLTYPTTEALRSMDD
jgi:hypothetical protein